MGQLRLLILALRFCLVFFFNDTATTEIYTLSLHDALPILGRDVGPVDAPAQHYFRARESPGRHDRRRCTRLCRSEEHTSELQSRLHLVCRLLLEKKKNTKYRIQERTSIDFNEPGTPNR